VCSVYCSHLSKLVCCIDMQVHVLQGSPTGFVQSFTDISWLIYQRTKFNINAYESNGCKYVHNCCTNHFSYFSDCLALYFLSKFLITVEPLLSGPLLSGHLCCCLDSPNQLCCQLPVTKFWLYKAQGGNLQNVVYLLGGLSILLLLIATTGC